MDDHRLQGRLVGSEIHGFGCLKDLDVQNMMEEAKSRWLRPNEIHAILCNHKYFTIHVKPMNLPTSNVLINAFGYLSLFSCLKLINLIICLWDEGQVYGWYYVLTIQCHLHGAGGTIVLFDRKKLRNFRKDGHNWKKKKDGKTVKEAHEHLKVGNEERIHVYYAHGEDYTTFVRRCYWLLDKSLEHIVLVHYRETQEGSPALSSPAVSDPSASWPLSEESDSVERAHYGDNTALLERNDSMTLKDHEQRLREINTLEWDELLMADDPNKLSIPERGKAAGGLPNTYQIHSLGTNDNAQVAGGESVSYSIGSNISNEAMLDLGSTVPEHMSSGESDLFQNHSLDGLQSHDSFGRWMARIIADNPGSVDTIEPSILTGHPPLASSLLNDHRSSTMGHTFNITDISPAWAFSSDSEDTKILIVGSFTDGHALHAETKVFLACGDSILQTEVVQGGVFRALLPPQPPGSVNIYLTLDGKTPISQVLTFNFRAPREPSNTYSSENKPNWEEYQLQLRLARLLLSTKSLDILSSKISQSVRKEAQTFAQKTSHITQSWLYLSKMIEESKLPFSQAKDGLFEVVLQNRLREWLIEKVLSGEKITERDEQGQSVIHLCAILGYTWVVYPYSCSGLSLDYRDKCGWTALHWAAYLGREKMVAALLSAGAKPNLVTDPTSDNRSGCNAADLASLNGHDGLSAYLAEKALVTQLNEMTLAGNVSGSLQTTTNEPANTGNFTEDELYLKDTLAAYRTAADAAARIQTAFREHSLKVRTQVVESSNPEIEARNIVAAMKIQHAFRNYESRKQMAAAARIQYRFRTWKMRKDFLNMRRKVIKIQAAFRGFQVRKQYRKICWSVGVLEKAILRWRHKRKGFRGLQVQTDAASEEPNNESDVEEDFFKASRKQAEERVERSVVRVQAMFRSKKAQEEYRRMKLEHNQAKLEFEGLLHPDTDMG